MKPALQKRVLIDEKIYFRTTALYHCKKCLTVLESGKYFSQSNTEQLTEPTSKKSKSRIGILRVKLAD